MPPPARPFPTGDQNPRRIAMARGQMRTRGPNKMPKDVASAIIAAVHIAGARRPNVKTGKRVHQSRGMINFFASLSDELLCGLVGRLLPRDIGVTLDANVTGEFQHVHSARDTRRDELQQQLLELHREIEALPADADVPPEQLVLLDNLTRAYREVAGPPG